MLQKQTVDANDPQSFIEALDKFPQGVEDANVFMCVKDFGLLRKFRRDSLTLVLDLKTMLTGHMATYEGRKIFVSGGIQSGTIYWATDPHRTIIWKNSSNKPSKDVSELDFPD